MESLAERSCACKDVDCARSILRDYGQLAAGANKHVEISNEFRERLVAAGHKLGLCLQRAGASEAEIREAVKAAE